MIEVECDRCEKTLSFPDDQAGERQPCPHCGDINRVPGTPAAKAASGDAKPIDRAAEAGLPPDSGPEQRVKLVRPAMLRARPFSFLGLAAVLLGGLGTLIYTLFAGPAWLGWVAGIAALLALGVLGVWKVLTFAASLEVTNKRSIMRTGLLRRSSSEVLHDSIRNIQIDQTFWNRVWRVGKIGISSSGQDGIEISLPDLPRPDEVRRVIDLYRPI